MADRQGRHLQGVTGPLIHVSPGESSCYYPVFFPPWMEIGRTSRSNVMAVGEIVDADGSRHKVAFSSQLQNEQIVRIKIEALSLDSTSVKVHPDGTGALKKTDHKPLENRVADGTPRFIWLPRMLARP